MYNQIKHLLRKIIPRKFIFKHEQLFRGIYYQFYRGENYNCNLCNKKLRKFIQIENGDRLCPNCGSSSRDRRLWQLLDSEFLRMNMKILDFSPSRSIYRRLKKQPFISYTSSDLSGDFLSEVRYDITKITAGVESYDLVICYHVLEHIENDIRAMEEIHRVLKNNGTCLVQTPYKDGEIYEDHAIKTEKDRLKHFGQKDHVRIYSVKGLKERLTSCSFDVEAKEFKVENDNLYGFESNETILICKK